MIVGGRWEIVRELGAGAMGTVYEARFGNDSVALKLLRVPEGSADVEQRRARFDREGQVYAKLNHPNLVSVIEHGVDDATGTPYLVMPLLRGKDLGTAMKEGGTPLEPKVAVSIVVQACEGVHAAHAAGVVHRDIKPSNLFLEEPTPGAPLRVRVMDFGLAKVHGELTGLTTSGSFMGTPHYTAPEQAINAKHADVKSDVWSLGMTLYHLLAGQTAFARTGTFMAFIVKVTQGSGVPALQDLAPWIPPRLARTVHGTLLRDPVARCPTPIELRLGLEMSVGWDWAHAELHAGDVRELSPDTRSNVQARAQLPRAWADLLRG